MRLLPLAVLGIASYGVFLVAMLPARHLAPRVDLATHGLVELREVEGTWWRGSAAANVRTPGGTIRIDHVGWDFRPARLVAGRLAFALEARGTGLDARLEAGRTLTGWSIRDLSASVDAGLAGAALPLLAPWRPEGRLGAATPSLDIKGGGELRGTLALDWKDAALALSQVSPLGAWRAQLSGEGGPARLTVTTVKGPLQVTGQGTFEWPGRLVFTGEARAEPAQAADLAPLLDLLGPARADGSRALDWRTR